MEWRTQRHCGRSETELAISSKIDMSAVSAVTRPDRTATITATLEISSVDKLSRVLAKLEGIKGVASVSRDVG